jgi:hypothetical protein
MDTTRRSIQETVDELREKVGEAMDCRSYIRRYPMASLGAAVVAGAVVGRWVGGRAADVYESGGRALPGAGLTAAATAGWSRAASSAAMSPSWSRAGSRLETIVNRMIDEAGDTIEQVLLPSLMNSFARLLGGDRAPSSTYASGEHRRMESERGVPA